MDNLKLALTQVDLLHVNVHQVGRILGIKKGSIRILQVVQRRLFPKHIPIQVLNTEGEILRVLLVLEGAVDKVGLRQDGNLDVVQLHLGQGLGDFDHSR